MHETPSSPISFRVDVLRLPRKGMPVTIDADETQRDELAREHELVAVERLHAEFLVVPWKGDGVRVTGHVEADVVQACVVTLDPVPAKVRAEVEAIYIPTGSSLARHMADPSGEILVDPDGPDAPEVFSGDKIDVGALAEEFFALELDPYPRSPGSGAGLPQGEEDAATAESPFAKLRELKPKR